MNDFRPKRIPLERASKEEQHDAHFSPAALSYDCIKNLISFYSHKSHIPPSSLASPVPAEPGCWMQEEEEGGQLKQLACQLAYPGNIREGGREGGTER